MKSVLKWFFFNKLNCRCTHLLVNSHLAIIPLCVSCLLQMGGRGHLVPVGGERLSGSAEGKVRTRPDHLHAARRPGQPEGGTLLPQEESRGGEIPAEATGNIGRGQRVFAHQDNHFARCQVQSCQNVHCLHGKVGSFTEWHHLKPQCSLLPQCSVADMWSCYLCRHAPLCVVMALQDIQTTPATRVFKPI